MDFKELEQIFESGTHEELTNFCIYNNLEIKDGKIFHTDKTYVGKKIAFWDKRQLVKKINLNS